MNHLPPDEARKRICDAISVAAEHVTDYVVIGRCRGGIVYTASDRTWAKGATRELLLKLDEEDKKDVWDAGE